MKNMPEGAISARIILQILVRCARQFIALAEKAERGETIT
jgi:hypothetical protein